MRAPAPRYRGKAPCALARERGPRLERFVLHRGETALSDERLVRAIDTRHLPLYWFPRHCPRCTFWAGERTTDADVARFSTAIAPRACPSPRSRWLERFGATTLQLDRIPARTFTHDRETAGYWTSREPVDALERITIDHLVGRHAAAGIRLRTVAKLWPLWDGVVESALEFSGMPLWNALPHA